MEKGPDLRVKLGGLYDKIAAKVAECTSLMRSTSEVLQSLAAAELSVDEAGMLVKSLSRANAERKEAVNAFRAEVAGLEQTLRVAKEVHRLPSPSCARRLPSPVPPSRSCFSLDLSPLLLLPCRSCWGPYPGNLLSAAP